VGVKWRKPVPTYAIDVNFSGIGGLGEFGEFLNNYNCASHTVL